MCHAANVKCVMRKRPSQRLSRAPGLGHAQGTYHTLRRPHYEVGLYVKGL